LTVYDRDGLTVPRRPDRRARWQEQFIAGLERAGVRRVVWCLGAGLRDFRVPTDPNGEVPDPSQPAPVVDTIPELRRYLDEHFEVEAEFGPFRVLRRKGSD